MSTKLLRISMFYNLRFGSCANNDSGDFIDNIKGKFNIYFANGIDDNDEEYFLMYTNNAFQAKKDQDILDNLDELAIGLKGIFNKDIASGLILAGYDNNPDGIIDHAPNYEEYYLKLEMTIMLRILSLVILLLPHLLMSATLQLI